MVNLTLQNRTPGQLLVGDLGFRVRVWRTTSDVGVYESGGAPNIDPHIVGFPYVYI